MPEEKKMVAAFTSNSHKARAEKREATKVEKVITGKVVTRKKSLGKRFMETFVGDDISNVSFYIIHDVLIPAAKNTLSDMLHGVTDMVIDGARKGAGVRREKGRSHISYNSMGSHNRRDERRDISPRNRARHNFDEVIIESRGEAEEVLSLLVDHAYEYGQVTVSDLYDLVGITGNFTDNKWGWVNLSSASVSRVSGGYMLNLPKTILLD